MSSAPDRHLILLHGRQNDESDGAWRQGFEEGLHHAGRRMSALCSAPDYLDLLDRKEAPRRSSLPVLTKLEVEPSADYGSRKRRFGKALGIQERKSGRGGLRSPADGRAVNAAIRFATGDVHRYRGDPDRKDAILRHVRRQLPEKGHVVLVGFSLGSVVALDLVRVLPPDLHVDLLLTIGSPLALQPLAGQLLGAQYGFPEATVALWLNVYDPNDIVTGRRALSATMPHALDVPVDNGSDRHSTRRYLAHPVVGDALRHIGLTTPRPTATARRRDSEETITVSTPQEQHSEELPADLLGRLVALQYASHVQAELPVGDRRTRHYQARLKVRDAVQVALDVRGWDVDPSDELAPLLRGRYRKGDAVGVLVELATSNPLAPFEVGVSKEARRAALGALAKDLRLGGDSWGSSVLDAVDMAKRAYERRLWRPILLGAAGLGLLVAGPLAVGVLGAAYTGAAALTAGLAALGPGGMAGGLWLVGLSAASGGATLRAAIATLSPEQLQIEVLRMQATGLLKQQRGIPRRGREERATLAAMLREAKAELAMHEKIDDPKSETIKAVQAKHELVRQASTWADKHLAGPT